MCSATPVSSSAIVTPRPVDPGQADAGTRARAGARPDRGRIRDADGVDALHARCPLERGDRARVERRGEPVQRPRETELGPDHDARRPRLEMNCPCAASAAAVHRRSSESLASPPARETRSARENAPSTTSTRWPVATGARVLPTSPLQPAASMRGGLAAPPPPAGAVRTAAIASRGNRGGRRGFTPPHRRPISADRAPQPRSGRRKRSSPHCRCRARAVRPSPPAAQRAARSLRPHRRRSRSARRRSGRRPRASGRRARGRSRAGTRPRGRRAAPRRRRSRTAYRSAVFTPENEKSSPGTFATGKSYAPASPSRRGGRSQRRPGSPGRGAERPCRTPRRLRRRESTRARGSPHDPGRRAGACALRSRAGRETAARRDPGWR